jgi:hypothetical protein
MSKLMHDYDEYPVRPRSFKGQIIDVNKSYELIMHIKNESFMRLSSNNSENKSTGPKAGGILSIDNKELSPNHKVYDDDGLFNRSPAASGAIPAHLKKLQEQKKWAEVLEFMEANPQIFLELMPPTPGRKFKIAVDHARSRSASPMIEDLNKEVGSTTHDAATRAESRPGTSIVSAPNRVES